MENKGPIHKGVYILPNLFTTGSLFTGFLAVIWAAQGNVEGSALAILISALLDGLDGKVARLTGTSSEFGLQYDSLADLVAFGVAPAFMAYSWHLHIYGSTGIAVAFLFVACGALRLARFNIITHTTPKKYSVGITITASGCAMACFVFFMPYVPEFMLPAVPGFMLSMTMLLAVLMVSRVRYYSFKEFGFMKAHPYSSLVTVILGFVLIASAPRLFGFLLCGGYALSGPAYTYIILPRRARRNPPLETPR
jgi:CDP-diacylglycerol--serine O-phosphatidyltransferase